MSANPYTRRASLGLAALFIGILAGCGPHRPAFESFSTLAEASRVARRDTDSEVPARIRGVVTFFDSVTGDCVLQDQTGSIRFSLRRGELQLTPGQSVEITGVLRANDQSTFLVEPSVSVLGSAGLPDAASISLKSDLTSFIDKRVKLRAVIEAVKSERAGGVSLVIRSDGTRATARMSDGSPMAFKHLADAEIEITGVLIEAGLPGQNNPAFSIWAHDLPDIHILSAPPQHLATRLVSARELLAADPNSLPDHRVRLQGDFRWSKLHEIELVDATGKVPVHFIGMSDAAPSGAADLIGFARRDNSRITLEDAQYVVAPGTVRETLRNAKAVHRLSAAAADMQMPVAIQAVVTYVNHASVAFVQDSTDGMFIMLRPDSVQPHLGDIVEVNGETVPGDFAPSVSNSVIRVVGRGRLPEPVSDIESAFAGQEDCRWAELRGVVQQAASITTGTSLVVQWGSHSYKALIPDQLDHPQQLIDREVTVQGVLGSVFNTRRQLLAVQLYIPGPEYIHVNANSTADAFTLRSRPSASLLQFTPGEISGHRVRVQGVVTMTNPSGPTFIKDESGGLLISSHAPVDLRPGDQVDTVGFPEMSPLGPRIHGASIRKLASGSPAEPVSVVAGQLTHGEFESQLIRIEGIYVSSSLTASSRMITLRSSPYLFGVRLPIDFRWSDLPRLKPGARLSVVGICTSTEKESRDFMAGAGFEVVLRSVGDLQIIHPAPWLSVDRLAFLLKGVLLLVVAALCWIVLLRRTVQNKTEVLTLKTEELETANRVANDALERTRAAESLELERKVILELIARNEPLENTLAAIARTCAKHLVSGGCSIQLDLPDGFRISATSQLSDREAAWLAHTEIAAIRETILSGSTTPPAPIAEWPTCGTPFADNSGASTYRAVPIFRERKIVGFFMVLSDQITRDTRKELEELQSWARLAGLAAERRGLFDELSYRAQYDSLTSLSNRECLYDRLERKLSEASLDGTSLAVVYIDLDGFKQANDRYGHDVGDEVLRQTAHRLQKRIRNTDFAARVGGDEFVIVLPGLCDRGEGKRIAALILDAIREPLEIRGLMLHMDASIGIAYYPEDGLERDTLLKRADQAMYRMKSQRKSLRWANELVGSTS